MNLNNLPLEVEKVPFKWDLEEVFQDKNAFVAYSSLHLSHSNIYSKYVEILKNTNVLLDLIDKMTGSSSITIDSINSEALNLIFDSVDLRIIQKADDILSDSSKWNRAEDMQCSDYIGSERYSLFCALYKASIDIAGGYKTMRPGVEMVKLRVNNYAQKRTLEDKIIEWNNHPNTTFDEVKKVLKESMVEVKKQLRERIQ